tara:strand:+ start:269 stop:805 length:537 start_codon:yes stop_codon:yes gene_type:complete
MDGTSEAGYMDSFQGEIPAFKPELNFSDIEDLEDKSEFVNNDEGEFDNFLTKRARERRKLRKSLIKEGGLSREEAKAKALEQIPKTKLGALVSNTLKGTTDVVTDEIVQASQEGVETNIPPVGTDVPTGSGLPPITSGTDAKGSWLGSNVSKILIGGVVVGLLVGGYFAFGKKLGIRK